MKDEIKEKLYEEMYFKLREQMEKDAAAEEKLKKKLLNRGIAFGFILAIVVVVWFTVVVKIENLRAIHGYGSLKEIYLWVVQIAVIAACVLIPIFVWKKLIAPYR